MKLQILKEDLTKALIQSLRFVALRAQLPILGNVVLNAKKNKLEISATNLEISFVSSIGAKVEIDGEIAVPGRTLVDIISNLKPGTITLETKKEQLEITSESFSGRVMALNTNDFPKIPRKLGEKAIVLPGENFKTSLSRVLFAASLDELRPILTGVLFIFGKKNLSLVASDGFRLSLDRLEVVGSEEKRVVLPKGVLSELVRMIEGEDVSMSFSVEEKQCVFGFGSTLVSSQVLEGVFPDFEKIIPKESQIKIFLDKEELLRSVKLASVFARESSNIVKMVVKKDAVEILAESQKSGSEKSKLEAKVEGTLKSDLEITYNFRFIEEFLGCVAGEEVQIGLNDAASAGVFTDPTTPSFLHLIMPVKIQG